jgi:hypothetical protein
MGTLYQVTNTGVEEISTVQGLTTSLTLQPFPSSGGSVFVKDDTGTTVITVHSGSATIAGAASSGSITLSNTTNQITLGTTNTTTINSTAPAASRTYTIPDTGTVSNFLLSGWGQIVNADINAAAAIVYSKLSLSNSIVNADINSSAAIAYSKLNLIGSIVNSDISASAAIAFSKLAALTSANILVGSALNVATSVSVTGDVSITNTGVTSISSGISNHLATREVPSGTINGSNVTFTLAFTPAPVGSEMVFLNGLLQNAGVSNDYTISGATITFNTAPLTGNVLLVTYWH